MSLQRGLASFRTGARLLARIGCVSIGTVYGGPVVIWAIVLGAAAYVAWRVIEAVSAPYCYGAGWKGLARRAGLASSTIGPALHHIPANARHLLQAPHERERDGASRIPVAAGAPAP